MQRMGLQYTAYCGVQVAMTVAQQPQTECLVSRLLSAVQPRLSIVHSQPTSDNHTDALALCPGGFLPHGVVVRGFNGREVSGEFFSPRVNVHIPMNRHSRPLPVVNYYQPSATAC